MAENVTLARPYAEAAFQLAKGSSTDLASWAETLARLSNITTDPVMEECIGNPQFNPAQLAQLYFEAAGGHLSADQQNFIRVLVDNNRLTVLPEIAALFDELKADAEGIKHAEITSAFPLDDATLKNLVAELERKFSCQIQATIKLDPELIGGVRMAVGDEVIDASVRGKLAAMAIALKN
ncbi:ATP synthase F0F1 subunit delta [Rugosibacter aromaticivorans]|uniref:ATP synthase subunit delta n=1 Tax=Rugosibacter aromaticivorans TaxID=1565605 RepID=A0A0C5JBZ3_9PROT|nr:F0F1 ATP synthase subunit delta [Rugosibacter aromaticivorans]AJP49284.1 ATP synthase F0F1 subunit delta [Rugosibacter aromaticivorans]TBR16527.1 MAG: F0F1 ATP synthase subunit delta [Rugosibacter sp.]